MLFDERSRNYGVTARTMGKPLRSYTWKCTPHLDQGTEGACVGFSIAHELAAKPVEVKVTEGTARMIYFAAQRIDPWPGGAYPGANPQYDGTAVLAGVKMAQSLGYCDGYKWAFGLNELLEGLAWFGPAVLGIPWHEGMVPDAMGRIRVSGEVIGGHAILAKGLDVRRKTVTLHNSWGTDWGRGGDCTVSFEDLAKLLKNQGEAVFLTGRRTPA